MADGYDANDYAHMRNSERGALKRCPAQWWWAWHHGLVAREPGKALWFGIGIHAALAHYYGLGAKRHTDFIDVWRAYANEEDMAIKMDEGEWVEARELGEAMLRGYHEHYGGDKHWDVIDTEHRFSVRIPYLDGNGFFIYDGTFDGVYRDKKDKKIKLMEHKTEGSQRRQYLPLDDQAGSYWAVAQVILRTKDILGPKENIRGITYNFLRKALPDKRPRNKQGQYLNKPTKQHYIDALLSEKIPIPKPATLDSLAEAAKKGGMVVRGEVSKRQPAPLFDRELVKRVPRERKTQIERIKAEMELANKYRSGELPIIKNPDDHCGWCPFREMCELHEQGADWEEFRDIVYRVRDPYEDHRKVA